MNHLTLAKLYLKLLETEKAQVVAEEGLVSLSDSESWARLAVFLIRLLRDTGQTEQATLRLNELLARPITDETRAVIHCLEGQISAEAGDFESARRSFQIAEASAMKAYDGLYASYGLCLLAYLERDWAYAMSLLRHLEVRIEQDGIEDELRGALYFSMAQVAWELNDRRTVELALEKAREIVRDSRSLWMQVQLLLTEAYLQLAFGETESAEQTLARAQVMLPRGSKLSFGQRIRILEERLKLMRAQPMLVLCTNGVHAALHWNGRVKDVTKQPQLVKLLEFLGTRTGQVASKEEICQLLWGEDYHPLRHDNKIYVTVRRLRTLLRDCVREFDVILNKDDGYFFQPQIQFQKQMKKGRQVLSLAEDL